MPVYEYQCKACHREFEYQQRMSDPDKTTCEVCGGSLDRLISRTAFQLKGSGWYKDLYSSSQKPAAAGGKAESGGEASGATASADKGGAAAGGASSDSSGGSTSGSSTPAGTGGSSSGTGGSASAAVASKAT